MSSPNTPLVRIQNHSIIFDNFLTLKSGDVDSPVLIYTLDIFRGIDPTTTKEI